MVNLYFISTLLTLLQIVANLVVTQLFRNSELHQISKTRAAGYEDENYDIEKGNIHEKPFIAIDILAEDGSSNSSVFYDTSFL